MAQPSAISDADWTQIRDAYILGVPASELAARFPVTPDYIRVRAQRYNWPTPARIAKATADRAAARAAAQANLPPVTSSGGADSDAAPAPAPASIPASVPPIQPRKPLTAVEGLGNGLIVESKSRELRSVMGGQNNTETVVDMAADGLVQLGEAGNLAGARLLNGLLMKALRAGTDALSPITDASEVVTALKGLRTAAGMDKESQVQVNLALFGHGQTEVNGFEV